MANEEHIALLKQGVKSWNQWREQYPEIQPDLSGTNLSGFGLNGANLSHTDLSETDLHGAYLINANLSQSTLCGSNLQDTDLDFANLREVSLNRASLINAHLVKADLNGADLSNANLSNADLSSAVLSGARLYKATMLFTTFAQIDLREVKGLTEIDYMGPSHVELYTLKLPLDGSALHFLRGCGVPDEWIDFYRSTMMHPIHYHSCFISYAHQDTNLAQRLHSDLQDHGVRCWFAPHKMHIGDKIRPRIDEAIHLQDKLLLILSEDSVASEWVEHEVETALAKERREKRTILFPIRLDNAILEREHIGWPALVQNERHIGDFTGWKDHDQYQVAFKRLLRDLKQADE